MAATLSQRCWAAPGVKLKVTAQTQTRNPKPKSLALPLSANCSCNLFFSFTSPSPTITKSSSVRTAVAAVDSDQLNSSDSAEKVSSFATLWLSDRISQVPICKFSNFFFDCNAAEIEQVLLRCGKCQVYA